MVLCVGEFVGEHAGKGKGTNTPRLLFDFFSFHARDQTENSRPNKVLRVNKVGLRVIK